MFLHVSVILSTGGGWSASVHAGIPPPDQAPPRTRHPPGTPWETETSHLREQTPPGAVHAGRYGQRAGDMHPTGMQSCSETFRYTFGQGRYNFQVISIFPNVGYGQAAQSRRKHRILEVPAGGTDQTRKVLTIHFYERSPSRPQTASASATPASDSANCFFFSIFLEINEI